MGRGKVSEALTVDKGPMELGKVGVGAGGKGQL